MDNIGYDQIVCGYGKPMATMYELEKGIPDGETNDGKIGKNFKNFGIMGFIQMTAEHKAIEDEYGRAVAHTNEVINTVLELTTTVDEKKTAKEYADAASTVPNAETIQANAAAELV